MRLRNRFFRTLGLALALAVLVPPVRASRPGPMAPLPAFPPQSLAPASWATFEECLTYLEGWIGRDLPEWVVHTTIFTYSARKPLYDRAGDPLLDPSGNQRCVQVRQSGRVFFPPAWRLKAGPRLPLVLYAHATMLQKTQAPSEFGGHEWLLAAAAALYYGFAVALPDQPGMGADALAYHSFCHAKSLAYSVVDALPTLARLTTEDPYLSQRRYGWDGQLFVLGYSEGAYSALAAVRELETHPRDNASPFTLSGSACMAGPFDLSGTTRLEMIDPVRPFAHCFYLPFVIRAYQEIYGDLIDPVAALAPVLLEQRGDGNILEWANGSMDGLTVDGLIGRRLGVPGDAVVLRKVLNPAWVQRELDDPAYATSVTRKLLIENDLCGGWRPSRPILFCQSLDDQDVPLQNTLCTLEGLGGEIRKAGGDPERLLPFLPIGRQADHLGHVAAALVAIPTAFRWFYSGMPITADR
jgi:pimeloyl-ACP methyl ester carboxylesterase